MRGREEISREREGEYRAYLRTKEATFKLNRRDEEKAGHNLPDKQFSLNSLLLVVE